MQNKLVFMMIDGLRLDKARLHMGFMEHLVEQKKAAFYQVHSQLPSLSRPMYELLLTGVVPAESQIVSNLSVQASKEESLFDLTSKNHLVNATASYYWVSELYEHAPFRIFQDRIQHHPDHPIQHGIFYMQDDYPDSHLLMDANYLLNTYAPDFLYIHSMNVDDAGHKFKPDSFEYCNKVAEIDNILSLCIPKWIEAGYQVIVTADHGMNPLGFHGGTSKEERHVPLYILSDKVAMEEHSDSFVSQLMIAPLACHLLQIEKSEKMQELALPGLKTGVN
ncbi:alkaline phosphatase family protein [Sporolactobacillus laevolacticus]|uniref:Metalloenzyme family protein n=1 Tax=Sporolactobacillus laevolacticus DSM 442 TaxID=1395513 RepID=V6J0K7_9BACL|nr:alkaline phosphatase family protein [Sporolactobacillus laevolacticus]EST12676.1 metalloenzyme family protein [Sporolactobacillus laevolacticus DSM 442]